jgi:PAS domain S-box-containing protein
VYLLVSASLQTVPENGEEKIIGSIRDITERRRAEEDLRESESRLLLALEATGAGTFDFYPRLGKLVCSDITKSHFGISPQSEVDHEMFLRAVHPDDRERVGHTVAWVAALDSGRQVATEFRTIGSEGGKERWIAVRGRMEFDRENRPARVTGTTLDISEYKWLEAELRRRAKEL